MYSKFLQKNTKLLKESKRKSFKRFKRVSESTPAYKADIEDYDGTYLKSVIGIFKRIHPMYKIVFDSFFDNYENPIDDLIEAKNIYVAKNGSKDTGTFTKNDAKAFFDKYSGDIADYIKSIGKDDSFYEYGKTYMTYGEEEAAFDVVCLVVDTIVAEFFDNVELDDSGLADED